MPELQSPKRFQTSKATLLVDRFMNHFIKIGGITIIAAVLGIFLFIFIQIMPLFQGAEVEELLSVQLPEDSYVALGMDEWAEHPFLVNREGTVTFADLQEGIHHRTVRPAFTEDKKITAVSYNHRHGNLVYGTEDGYFSVVEIQYKPSYKAGRRTIAAEVVPGPFYELGSERFPVREIAYGNAGETQLVAAIKGNPGEWKIVAAALVRERTLLGMGEISVGQTYDLSAQVKGRPERILVNKNADTVLVSTAEGVIYYFFKETGTFDLRQTFVPFEEEKDQRIASMHYLFGDVSLVLTNPEGRNVLYSLYIPERKNRRIFSRTKNFKELPAGAEFYSPSLRNKAFLTGTGSHASLRYGTTESIRWEEELPYAVSLGFIGRKYDRLAFLDHESGFIF